MARKSKYRASTVRRQAQKQRAKEARAEWRKLERLGVVKKRARVDGKLAPLKITAYKQQRLRQLAPLLNGSATAVSLGPTALRKARENKIPLAGRFAIVPDTQSARRAVREGRDIPDTHEFAFRQNAEAIVRAVIDAKPITPTRFIRSQHHKKVREVANFKNETTIAAQIAKLDAKAKSAISRAAQKEMKNASWGDWMDWWQQWAEEYEYDADDSPFLYH